jgi:hypothetical protein
MMLRLVTIRSDDGELGGRDMVDLVRLHGGPDEGAGLSDEIVDEAGTEDAKPAADLLRRRQVDDHGKPHAARIVPCSVFQVFQKLSSIGQAADHVDPAEGMLKLDLAHHHRSEVLKRRPLAFARLPRLDAKHAERAKSVALARHQRVRQHSSECLALRGRSGCSRGDREDPG